MHPAVRVGIFAGLLFFSVAARAWEHVGSKVAFTEYRIGLIEELRDQERPYFLLFSAEWCHWCHEFGENTLRDDKVAEYLNAHYINIFIDADVHSAAYLKYQATGLPYTVFLNPDTSPHFRYAGTLYAGDFLTVITTLSASAMSASGSPSTTTKSAIMPALSVPMSCATPAAWADFEVAARSICAGLSPARA